MRFVSLGALIFLIMSYGDFHRGLMEQKDTPPREVTLPAKPMWKAIVWATVMVVGVASGLFAGARGAGVRLLGSLALVAVMIQGLLGGFRVKLNELFGTDLAAFHGVFAQVVFGLLVTLAVLTARPVATDTGEKGRRLRLWASALAHLIFLQVVFGAFVRHYPTPLAQRLHFVTAFAATAVAVLVLRAVFADPAARRRAAAFAWCWRSWSRCNCTSAWKRGWRSSASTRCRNWSR